MHPLWVAWTGIHIPNYLAVDSARDAVLQFEIHFGHGVVGEDGGVGDIA